DAPTGGGGCNDDLPVRRVTCLLRDIEHHLACTLGTDLSHETISNIIDAITDEVLAWQTRPLEPFYPAGVSRCDLGENSRWGSRAQQGRPHRYRCGYGRD